MLVDCARSETSSSDHNEDMAASGSKTGLTCMLECVKEVTNNCTSCLCLTLFAIYRQKSITQSVVFRDVKLLGKLTGNGRKEPGRYAIYPLVIIKAIQLL